MAKVMAQRAHLIGLVASMLFLAAVPFLTSNAFYLKVLFSIAVNYLAATGLNVLVGHAASAS